MIKVINAQFLISCLHEYIAQSKAEVVFLGRSNVGKSSLINALCNHKNLAKKSSTPGKTRLVNFFEITYNTEDKKQVHFVDLPGYGYAKVSKKEQNIWERTLTKFLENRLSVRLFLLLVDSRHVDLKLDEQVYEYIKSIKKGDQQIIKVYTKIDKLTQKQLHVVKQTQDSICVSASKKINIDTLNEKIFLSLLGENAL